MSSPHVDDSGGRTALLVDDAADIRLLQGAVLSRLGFTVSEAEGGREALSYLDSHDPPTVVVLDVQMPDIDGWDTLAEIRRRPGGTEVPVVFCTVKSAREDESRAWSAGCDGYVVKPFTLECLAQAVNNAVSRSLDARLRARHNRLRELQTQVGKG